MTRKEFINKRVQEHYEEAISLGYEVVGVFLQGSQNYELDEYSDEYMSDIDTKCIILPNLDNIISNKAPYSYTYCRANNEHIDIKDIRIMFEMFKKQNNSYIEILFTEFKVVNPKYISLLEQVITQAEKIARINFNQALRCLSGTSMEKYKALEHPYPGTIDKIEKFGYDPKQLHHILRVNDLMRKYISGKSYKDCLIPDDKKQLMEIKKGCLSLEDAIVMALDVDRDSYLLMESNLLFPEQFDYETINFLDGMKAKFIKQYLIEELKS